MEGELVCYEFWVQSVELCRMTDVDLGFLI